jgi:7-cyano-7-deazaguanine synthase
MKYIFLLSGGLDSTINLGLVLKWTAEELSPSLEFPEQVPQKIREEVECLTFDYGQRHHREIDAAREISKSYGLKHKIIEAKFFEGCALVGDCDLENGKSETAIVPNRNMVFLSIAAAYAMQQGASHVYWSAIKDDADLFKDCRPEFLENMNRALNPMGVKILAPIIGKTKKEIVKIAVEEKIDFSQSWSCYRGGQEPCGKCGACLLREEAIDEAFSV